MTRIDQFESIFRAAAHESFRYEPFTAGTAVSVSRGNRGDSLEFRKTVEALLPGAPALASTHWHELDLEESAGADSGSGDSAPTRGLDTAELLRRLDALRPQLVCVERNPLGRGAHFGLSDHIEWLTQALGVPLLVLPHGGGGPVSSPEAPRRVIAITDHLTGHHALVSIAASFTPDSGVLTLSHVEDEATFERYLDLISKIPSIDTDNAREELHRLILKQPRDYIESCKKGLAAAERRLQIEAVVTFGRRLAEYRRLVEEHSVDLLVLNSQEEDQLAMHGMAYPLAVELKSTPLLFL